jgi:high-affinity iron transporter
MTAALIIVFREILEAGMIVGIVMAATRGVVASRLWIAGGIAAGVLGSFVAAGCIGVITAAFSGMGQELLNATILSIAVVMLATHNSWMSRHGRDLARHVKATGEAVSAHRKSLAALAIVVGLAVLREGSEIALFLYGSIAAGGSSAQSMIAGGMLGLASGAALTVLTYFGLLQIPGKLLFPVTSALITFIAASMAAQAVFFLEQAGVVTTLAATAWDSSGLMPQDGFTGSILHSLIGYNDQPSWMQVAVYILTILLISCLMRVFRFHSSRPIKRAAQGSHLPVAR